MKRLNSFRRGERIFRNVVANVAGAAIGFTAELLTAVSSQKTSKSGHAQLRDTLVSIRIINRPPRRA